MSKHQIDNNEDFSAMLENFMGGQDSFEGKVVKGLIVSIKSGLAIVDIGLKAEGRVSIKEIMGRMSQQEPKVGDWIDVYVERMEDKNGEALLSIEKAKREAAWVQLEQSHLDNLSVNGFISGRVKGGFAVDLGGVTAFLPGSQVDIRPIRDVSPLMNIIQPFKILKMDKLRGNIVVSRRSVLDETRNEARNELFSNIQENQIITGVVKNIVDYGAFIDLGGVDGLLHVTDIAWRRVNHPSEKLTVGDSVDVQVIRYNASTGRISLGMKQLTEDPWKGVAERYISGARIKGKVTNITDYGAFVEIEPAIEGLIHLTEMSWTKKNIHPSKIVSLEQEVEVVVLEVDQSKRRISLGLKQCIENPWEQAKLSYPVDSILECMIKNVTEFGLFVKVTEDLDGMVHLSDLSWDMPGEKAVMNYKKGDVIKVIVLEIDPTRERISLGIKQLTNDGYADQVSAIKKGDVVSCTVSSIDGNEGLYVNLAEGVTGYIKKSDLSKDRSEQRTDKFSVGEKIDAKITQVDKTSRRINLSIKLREEEEEKKALSEYGYSDSGASLGDILGAAMDKAKDKYQS